MPVFESVPNISEGRDLDLVRRLARAAQAGGARLLDLSSDPDHHRSVLTLAGEPDELHDGLLALFARAVESIDMRRHSGAHPRIGAVDVVPFIPLQPRHMAAAVGAAVRLGEAVAERFGVPVYLYGEAARSARRRLLSELRRGGFEALERQLAAPDGRPDFGPPRPHPTAGVTAIGARGFLIAFNVGLDTADVELARRIARRIRASSGGLTGVQALGVFLETRGRAQVTMNLLDTSRSPLSRVLAAVEQEAAREGARVAEVELVGLLPEADFREALTHPLLRRHLVENRILERRLEASLSRP